MNRPYGRIDIVLKAISHEWLVSVAYWPLSAVIPSPGFLGDRLQREAIPPIPEEEDGSPFARG
jgi:hypothetical protein